MKYKFPIILTLLIMLPISLLAWMGTRLFENDKVVAAHQLQQLINSQLREADQRILGYFTELESLLLKTPTFSRQSKNPQAIDDNLVRQHIAQSPYIENVFILNANGERIFPNPQRASTKELSFIAKTQELWASMDAFQPDTPSDIQSVQEQRSKAEKKDTSRFSVSGALGKLSRQQDLKNRYELESSQDAVVASVPQELQESAIALNTGHGWTLWRTGVESQIFFWFWNQQNQLTGLKLANAYWLAELLNRLPDDRNATELIGNAKIQLLNEKQDVLYQWGPFEQSGTDQPLGQRLLGQPLDSWRLAYFAPNQGDNRGQWLLYALLLFLVGLVLASLGFIIYREYRRDMRIAEQRVTFVNQVSHELKTPLTNICLYAELLESEAHETDSDWTDETGSKISRYTQVLISESQRLGRLINNVLSFSKAQQQEQTLEFQTGEIDSTIRSTAEMFKPAFLSKTIQLELDLQAPNLVSFDHNALEQILNNLLGNIEKYAHQGNYALIRSEQFDNTTRIHIIDHGPGIDKKTASRIFDPFFRGSSKLSEGVSGTGIGLNIARTLCRLHGGDLTLNLEHYADQKQGAHFMITLKTPQHS